MDSHLLPHLFIKCNLLRMFPTFSLVLSFILCWPQQPLATYFPAARVLTNQTHGTSPCRPRRKWADLSSKSLRPLPQFSSSFLGSPQVWIKPSSRALPYFRLFPHASAAFRGTQVLTSPVLVQQCPSALCLCQQWPQIPGPRPRKWTRW